jgi:hypothetical protein
MKMESAQKRLAYQESVWRVKEIDLIEDKRKLELRIGLCPSRDWDLTEALQEREMDAMQREVAEASAQAQVTHRVECIDHGRLRWRACMAG